MTEFCLVGVNNLGTRPLRSELRVRFLIPECAPPHLLGGLSALPQVMGMMQGKTVGDTFYVLDSFALPVEGTETRVNAANEANEYMVAFLESSREVGRQARASPRRPLRRTRPLLAAATSLPRPHPEATIPPPTHLRHRRTSWGGTTLTRGTGAGCPGSTAAPRCSTSSSRCVHAPRHCRQLLRFQGVESQAPRPPYACDPGLSRATPQEPFLAIIIDPVRTCAAGRVEIGAFRTFPEGYKPSGEEQSEYQTIPLNKIEDFGVHANQYYTCGPGGGCGV